MHRFPRGIIILRCKPKIFAAFRLCLRLNIVDKVGQTEQDNCGVILVPLNQLTEYFLVVIEQRGVKVSAIK